MRTPGFAEAVLIAAIGCVLAGVSYAALGYLLPSYEAVRLVIAMTGLGYMLWLAARAPARSGRVFVMAIWCVGTLCTLVLDPPVVLHLATQLAFFWLLRLVCHHRGVLIACVDAAIGIAAMAAAMWAASATGSVFVIAWCVLLVQGLFTLLPAHARARSGASSDADKRFERAQRTAHAAVRRLSSQS